MTDTLPAVLAAFAAVKSEFPTPLSAGSVIEDLGLDSLEEVEVLLSLEERLGVELDQTELARCQTLGDLAALIARSTPA